MSLVVKNLQDLRTAVKESGMKLSAAPVVSARRSGKKKEEAPSIPGLGKKPTLDASVNIEEMCGQLIAVIDAAVSGRGFAAVMAFADHAIACISAAEMRKGNGVSEDKAVVRALESIVSQAGVHARGAYQPATRGRRVIQMLQECPGVLDGQLVRLRGGELQAVENAREAASALDVFEHLLGAPLDQQFLSDLEVAKSTKLDSLRSPVLRRMRKITPDLGAALAIAALAQRGFTKTGLPNPNFVWLSFNALQWMIAVLVDLREVLSDENEESRGWLFLPHLSEAVAVDYDQYGELAKKIGEIRLDNNAPASARQRAEERYQADKAVYDEVLAQWNAIQAEVEDIQQEAVNVVDGVLSFLRHKVAEKEWLIANDKASRGHGQGQKVEQREATQKVVTPAPRTKAERANSVNTPKEAIDQLIAAHTEVETEISLPVINHAALGIAEVEIRKGFMADGIEGGRICEAYPGVIWEPVIGPMYHALDISQDESDCRLIVIAPRRKAGLGLDLTESRVLMLSEYEDFFTPVEE